MDFSTRASSIDLSYIRSRLVEIISYLVEIINTMKHEYYE